MSETIVTIIECVASFIVGGGLLTLITVRSLRRKANAEAKGAEVDVAAKVSTEYDKLLSVYKQELERVDELWKKVTDLQQKVNTLESDFGITVLWFCSDKTCPKRCPPFGTATKEAIRQCLHIGENDQ